MFSEGKKWAPGLRGCEREGGQSLAGSLLAVATHAQCIEAMPVARAVDTLSAPGPLFTSLFQIRS